MGASDLALVTTAEEPERTRATSYVRRPLDGASDPGPQQDGRVAALDVVRGLLLIVSVVTSSLLAPPEWFEHATWVGVHPLDLVFPAFVVLTGAGLGLAYRKGVKVRRLLRRVAVLLLAGLAYNYAMAWARDGAVDLGEMRWTGVLQLYAALVLVIAVLHLLIRGWVAWLLTSLGLGAGHTAVLIWWTGRCPGQRLTPQCNPSLSIDGAFFPDHHLYWQLSAGHDPEGVIALLGACATAAAGTAAAHALRRGGQPLRHSRRRLSRPPATSSITANFVRLMAIAVTLTAASVMAGLFVPTMKRLWTAPFGLGIAAAVIMFVAVVHVIVDAPSLALRVSPPPCIAQRRWWNSFVLRMREPLIALGRNSLLVYFGSHVVIAFLLLRPLGSESSTASTYATSLSEGLSWLGGAQAGFSIAVLGLWWALAWRLHRHCWYLRA